MKKTILDIREMSDSKEVYGQRPNPFISLFIYCLVGLLIAAIIYACFGKMEIVATASGIVRPNDDVSTLSCLLSGRITDAHYSDGQFVQKGDILLSIDTSENQILLDSLKKKKQDYEMQNAMFEKFRKGIENGTNPFSDNPESEEYSYYVQYRDYELSLKNTKESYEYDAATASANIQAITAQISELENKLAGLNSYKQSVQNGKNYSTEYPEYDRLYNLYASSIKTVEANYQLQRNKIVQDQSDINNDYYLKQYQTMATEYGYLVESIQYGISVFPTNDTSICKTLYDEYQTNIARYEQEKDISLEAYKSKTLAAYQQALSDYENKILETQSAISSTEDKETKLAALDASYQNEIEQQQLQTLTQIDSSVQLTQTELASARSDLQLYEIGDDLYKSNTDENNTPVPISLASVKQVAEIISQQEVLKNQVEELDTQIKQTEDQIAQGTIKAERSGVISVNAVFVKGDTISAGTIIGTIIPFDEC